MNETRTAGLEAQNQREEPAEQHKRLLHRGAINAFLVSVLGAAAGFGAHVIVARAVGKSEYGIYGLMLSWVSVLAVIAQAGQDSNVVRLLPTYSARGQWGKVKGLRYGAGALVLLLSIAIAVTGCVVVAVAGREQSASWRETFYIGFAMLPILTQLQQSGAMHRAFKRAIGANAYITIGRPAALIAIMIAIMAYVHPVSARVAAAASALSVTVALALSTAHMSWAWPVEARGVRPQYEMSHWTRMGLRMCILSWMAVATNRVDVLLLGALMGSSEVGPYYAAVNIAGFAFYAFQAVNVVLAPLIAERYDAGDLMGLEALVRRGARVGLLGGIVTTVSIALVGHWTLGVFGPGFTAAYYPLLILLCGYFAVTAIGPGGFVLSMTNYQSQASVFAGIGLVVNVVLTTLLAPRFGAVGAALSSAIQLVIWQSLMLRFVVEKLRINSSAFGPSLVGRAPV
ncbi:MAG TPA: oligosaccharide flippase family protein [Steroidobacteraceae bacterium]|jgi:O-antigen/teichoic acid export membrane protein|nr:oligosaccharide flippase family protein [Steroidobacteraceae bacterium]